MSGSLGMASPATAAAMSPPAAAAAMSPMNQQQSSYFSAMTPEQLQEMAIRMKGSPQGQMAQRMLAQKRILSAEQPADSSQQQSAPTQAGSSQTPQGFAHGGLTGPPRHYALGGAMDPHGGVFMTERGVSPSGFLHTAGPGRSDNLNINPISDSYVLPADVISGLGEGNSLAGAKAFEATLSTGPHGVPLPSAGHHTSFPSPPRPGEANMTHFARPGGGFANGGFAGGGSAGGGFANDNIGFARGHNGGPPLDDDDKPPSVPIVAAGGEYVLNPEQVAAVGHGSIRRGHAILDAFVLHIRKRTIGELRKLKGPVKS